MRRRDFVILLGCAAGLRPLAVRAQQKPMPVIGLLGAVSPEVRGVQLNLAAFREGLGEMGFVEGQNVTTNTAGRSGASIGCPPWLPSWSSAMSTSS